MNDPLIHSTWSDGDMRDLLELFVSELPQKIAECRNALDAQDWERLRTTAHRLKGAAGSYGFPLISQAALILETSARERKPSATIQEHMLALTQLCERARA